MPFTSEDRQKPRATNEASPLQRRRIKAGLTLKQLADELEVSAVQVQRWESGKTAISKVVRLALDAVLGKDEDGETGADQ